MTETGMPRELEIRIESKAAIYLEEGYNINQSYELAMEDQETWIGFENWI